MLSSAVGIHQKVRVCPLLCKMEETEAVTKSDYQYIDHVDLSDDPKVYVHLLQLFSDP